MSVPLGRRMAVVDIDARSGTKESIRRTRKRCN